MTRLLLTGLAGLLLSGSAYAQPRGPNPDGRAPPRTNERDRSEADWDRGERSHYDHLDRWGGNRTYLNRWITLAPDNTATTDRQFINVKGQVFERVRLEATRGSPYISQVAILYVRGGSQVVKVNARLAPGAGEVIRTNGEPIQRIVVYTEPRYRGSYGVFAAQRPDRSVRR